MNVGKRLRWRSGEQVKVPVKHAEDCQNIQYDNVFQIFLQVFSWIFWIEVNHGTYQGYSAGKGDEINEESQMLHEFI